MHDYTISDFYFQRRIFDQNYRYEVSSTRTFVEREQGVLRRIIVDYELEEHDVLLLVKPMEAFDLAEKCRRILDKEGVTYTDRFGAPRARPEAKILNDSRNREEHFS